MEEAMSTTRNLKLGLSPEAVAARRSYIGGSDANILLSGDPRAIHELWMVKTGRAEPEDLSNILAVVMGLWTEELNRYWYERQTGRMVMNEGVVISNTDAGDYMRATLDGETCTAAEEPAVFEAKHVNAFSKIEDVVQRYMPQLHHNMFCAGREFAVLSVFLGTQQWECYEVARDPQYMVALLEHEAAFWQAVTDNHPPVELPAIAAPIPPAQWRTVDMAGSNAWAIFAADWLEHKSAAKTFETAAKGLKGLIEPDVGLAIGHGIQCKRTKAGALSISEVKEKKNAA
jgi:predicted phage-related endonuclease